MLLKHPLKSSPRAPGITTRISLTTVRIGIPRRYFELVSSLCEFSHAFREQFRQLLLHRRDVRRFRSTPLPDGLLDELLDLTRLAPSVGLSQPWRFVKVDNLVRREDIRAEFERANKEALDDYSGEQAKRYARLKLAGLDCAPVHLAVFADHGTFKGSKLGRRTMPEMLAYSVVAAVTTLWLAARAYGIGMGWVSILDPGQVTAILAVDPSWQLVAYLCLGYPEEESLIPELQQAGWEERDTAEVRFLQR